MSDTVRLRIKLLDEAPAIGAGMRLVTVKVGKKWVRLKSAAGSVKLSKAAWAPIARLALPHPSQTTTTKT